MSKPIESLRRSKRNGGTVTVGNVADIFDRELSTLIEEWLVVAKERELTNTRVSHEERSPASGGGIPEPPEHPTETQSNRAINVLKRWHSLSLPTFTLVGLLTLGLLWILVSRNGGPSAARWIPASQRVAPEDARLISEPDSYRLATIRDFAPDSITWLSISGQQASGDIPGAYSATGWSHAYVLVGKDSMWRVLIVANGQLRCDARYRTIAIVAHLPKNLIREIDWSDRPPAEPEGDGLLIVRAANDPASGVVLFLQGDQVVTGTPSNYYQALQSQTR